MLDPMAEEVAGVLEAKGLVKLRRQDLKCSGEPSLVVVRERSQLRLVGEKLLRSLDALRSSFEGSAGLQKIIERARAGTHKDLSKQACDRVRYAFRAYRRAHADSNCSRSRRLAGDASGSPRKVVVAKLSDFGVVAVAEDRRGFLAHSGDDGDSRST